MRLESFNSNTRGETSFGGGRLGGQQSAPKCWWPADPFEKATKELSARLLCWSARSMASFLFIWAGEEAAIAEPGSMVASKLLKFAITAIAETPFVAEATRGRQRALTYNHIGRAVCRLPTAFCRSSRAQIERRLALSITSGTAPVDKAWLRFRATRPQVARGDLRAQKWCGSERTRATWIARRQM